MAVSFEYCVEANAFCKAFSKMSSIHGEDGHGRRAAFERWMNDVEAKLLAHAESEAGQQRGEKLSDAQLRELEETFDLLDKDDNGTITIPELKQVISKYQLAAPEAAERMMNEIDEDHK